MLKILRHKNVTKVVLWGLLILVLPAFVLWGTGAGGRDRSKSKGPTFVGLIDNKKVTFNDFAESLTAIRCQIILSYFNQPEVVNEILKSQAFLGKFAWNRLIMAREARKAKIKVSNADVVNFIRSQPLFSRGGAFDDRIYSYVLRNNVSLEPREFEEMVRTSLGIQKFADRITKDIKATDEEITTAYGKDNDKIKISYLLFTPDSFTDKVKIDEKQTPGRSRELAIASAREQHEKLKDLMAKENLNFEAAAKKLRLEIKESALFSKNESLEAIGPANPLVEASANLKGDELSTVIETDKGAVLFRVTERRKFDEEAFKKEKDAYAKKVAEPKKSQYLDAWMKRHENSDKINIDLNDYEKYYR